VELSLQEHVPLVFGNYSDKLYDIDENTHKLDKLEKLVLEEPQIIDEKLVSFNSILCGITPITEADAMAKALVFTHQNHKIIVPFLKFFVKLEVQQSEHENTLFRGNSIVTKMFKFYSKIVGLPYLFTTLAPIIYEICSTADPDVKANDNDSLSRLSQKSSDIELDERGSISLKLDTTIKHAFKFNVEVDPTKMTEQDDSDVNTYSLLLFSQKILVAIFKSATYCPIELREFLRNVREEVQLKYPGASQKSIGSFLFLRFFCSAVTVPDSYGLIKIKPSLAGRRNLVLVAKVLQNLANEITFGKKENYMIKMNDFIETNIPKLGGFYDKLTTSTPEQQATETPAISNLVRINALCAIYNHIILFKPKFDDVLPIDDNASIDPIKKGIAKRLHEAIEAAGFNGQAIPKYTSSSSKLHHSNANHSKSDNL